MILLAAHAPLLFVLGTYSGTERYVTGATFTAAPLEHVLLGVGAVVVLALVAGWSGLPRRFRTAVTSIGLMTSSALLVYFSGGYIEAHFPISDVRSQLDALAGQTGRLQERLDAFRCEGSGHDRDDPSPHSVT